MQFPGARTTADESEIVTEIEIEAVAFVVRNEKNVNFLNFLIFSTELDAEWPRLRSLLASSRPLSFSLSHSNASSHSQAQVRLH